MRASRHSNPATIPEGIRGRLRKLGLGPDDLDEYAARAQGVDHERVCRTLEGGREWERVSPRLTAAEREYRDSLRAARLGLDAALEAVARWYAKHVVVVPAPPQLPAGSPEALGFRPYPARKRPPAAPRPAPLADADRLLFPVRQKVAELQALLKSDPERASDPLLRRDGRRPPGRPHRPWLSGGPGFPGKSIREKLKLAGCDDQLTTFLLVSTGFLASRNRSR